MTATLKSRMHSQAAWSIPRWQPDTVVGDESSAAASATVPTDQSPMAPIVHPDESTSERKTKGLIVRVFGERFRLERDADEWYLSHPLWSLMGSGSNATEALKSLLDEARELSLVYRDLPLASLEPEAAQLQRFLLRFP